MSNLTYDFVDEMRWRGMLHQCTNEAGLVEHLASGKRLAYAGFDPTADSLTIGNLVTIMALARFQRAGHTPVAVMGGGTGLIGDPSGKSAERQLMTRERVSDNVDRIKQIFSNLLDFSPRSANAAVMLNNLDWLQHISYLDALRDIGKHFSVNMMIQRDSVKDRLHNRDQGISYTEFSYMILQAYDYLHLCRTGGVTLQMGGSDQWGNIVSGADLIRRSGVTAPRQVAMSQQVLPGLLAPGAPIIVEEGEIEQECFGLTWPLVTKSDGGKFGKTETGAIWLTADRTSPYAYYQFWLNSADADVVPYLKIFTHLSREEIGALEIYHQKDPGLREAHRALARAATELLHGSTEMHNAEAAAKALFSGDIAGLPVATLAELFAAAPSSSHSKALLAGEGLPLVDLLAQTSLATSKGQAKQHLTEGSVSVNGTKAAPDARLTTDSLLHGSLIAIRRGKKNWHVTRWE